jgi:hypothetical protein
MARLTDKTLAQSTAITPTTLIHIVYTGDPSQNPAGSSYKAELQQLGSIFAGISFSGGTVNGASVFTNGLSANTISATTYQNLPVSGLTEGSNISISGTNGNFTISVTGITSGGGTFSGGTVSGSTSFTNGLTANTISATTYQNLPISGTHNYLSKFSSGSTILVDSQIIDDGTYVSINTTPISTLRLYVHSSTESTIGGFTQSNGSQGVYGQSYGVGLGKNTGVYGSAFFGQPSVGVYGTATSDIGTIAYGGEFNAVGAGTNYSLKLTDGTEGIGKVLTCMTSNGDANWQTLPSSTFSGGTITGATSFTNGLSANTISATTYQNLPVSGLTAGTNIGLTNNDGNYTISVTGITGGSSINPFNDIGSTTSPIVWNVSGVSTNYEATLTAITTTLNLTNVRNGDYGTIILKQDGVGSRVISLGTVNGGAGTHRVANNNLGFLLLTSNANAIDIATFTYNGSVMYWTVANDFS